MKYPIAFILILLLVACQKAPERVCWKATGTIENMIAPLSSFQYLYIHPYIEVALVHDSLNYVEWQAGSNLLSFLTAEIEADTLKLYNKNGCRFLRYQKGKVIAVVHFTSLKELHLANSESVRTVKTWLADDLLVYLKEGVGSVSLALNVQKATIRNNYGWQTLKLSGNVAALFVDLDGSASLQAPSLMVQDSISFRSTSPLSSWVRSGQLKLKAQLYGAGDLFYTGTPSVLLKTEYSTGKVLAKQ
jgi:hypothetical protein